ncbi:hypothetical protein N7G274_010879 [Stereocaulon virgatum]|uniref:Uncharacterized protein n=2 Tax=Stereocaulon virgatum TaxID=373712 RepID=A0ABR3ZTQ1_9LECA
MLMLSNATAHYHPLSQSACATNAVENFVDDSEEYALSTRIHAGNHGRLMMLSISTALLLISTIIQALCLSSARASHEGVLSYTGLNSARNIERLGSVPTPYMAENETEAAQAWSAIEPGHGVVALDPQWAAINGLPATKAHPINSDKVVYIIEAYHAIHCLKVIRLHYSALMDELGMDWPVEHDMHCFDTLRQHIMCQADDTLLSTTGHRDAGMNQTRMCRDWDALRQWATEHTACYHDTVGIHNDARFERCDGGEDGLPRNSLLELS